MLASIYSENCVMSPLGRDLHYSVFKTLTKRKDAPARGVLFVLEMPHTCFIEVFSVEYIGSLVRAISSAGAV
jgi:hypothetical protein